MTKYLFIICLFLFTHFSTYAQTQLDMNSEANATYLKVDKKLNEIYKKIIIEYKDQPIFLGKLKASQKAWLQFRDAEVNTLLPLKKNEAGNFVYGSVFPMCYSMNLTKITEDRVKQLQVWLDGIEEGDVCSGSVKIK